MTSSFILSVGGRLPLLRTLAKDVTNSTDSAYAKNNELFLCISLCSVVLACIRQSYGIYMTAALTHIVDVKIPCNYDLHFWLHWTFGGPATQLCIIFNQDDAATRNINWEPFLAVKW